MISLIEKIFFIHKFKENTPSWRSAYGILSGILGIIFNILLFGIKFYAGFISNSIAITADAFNNLSDASSSIITLIGFKIASGQPDEDHPFGHGRVEYLSGFLVSVIIIYMSFELLKQSFQKIIHPESSQFSITIIVILLFSIVVKCYMAYYNFRLSKKIDSPSLKATGIDSLSDTIATTFVLFGAIFSHYTSFNIDGYCGILVGLFILYAGINAAKDTINPLLGQPPSKHFVERVEEIIYSYDIVLGIHDLIVHNYGPGRVILSVHVEVSAEGDLLSIHDTIDLIEHSLKDILKCSPVIHMDPVCINDTRTKELYGQTLNIIHEIDPNLTIHDFRIVSGPTHTNLIFDIVTPYNYKYSDQEICEIIDQKIKELDKTFYTKIDVDKKY